MDYTPSRLHATESGISSGRVGHAALQYGTSVCLLLNVFLLNCIFLFSQRFLGDYSDGLFTDNAAIEAILRFQGKLNEISMEIKERNKHLEVPYSYLLPERTPNSIAI